MFTDEIKQKRRTNEMRKLQKSELGFAQISFSEDNTREFHFLLKGHDDSEYKGGYYIGKITIHQDYPEKAGDFMMLTPSGRFDINKNICLSNSAYHQNEHSPLWSIENMVVGMASIFHEEDHNEKGQPKHSISHRYDSKEQRKIYAGQSLSYNMTHYSNLFTKFNQLIDEHGFPKVNQIVKPLESEAKEPKKKQQEVVPTHETIVVDISKDELKVEIIQPEPITQIKVTTSPKQKTIIGTLKNLILPKKKEKKTVIQIEPPNMSVSPTKRENLLKEKLEQIKEMPFDKFDIKPYQEVNSLLSPVNLSEL